MIALSAANYYAGFVRTDVELLRRLDEVQLTPPSKAPAPWAKARTIRKARAVFGWFADLSNLDTGLLCRVLRKRFILAVAGYELANMPEYDYGLQRRYISRAVVRRCFRLADVLTFLHEGLRAEAAQFDSVSRAKMVVIPPGFAGAFWTAGSDVDRTVVTSVVAADTLPRFRVKGGPIVLNVARRFPSVRFVLVGVQPEIRKFVQGNAPGNVGLEPILPPEDLRTLFRKSIAVLQPSAREVFPNSVCEAMLCGAIPVVSPLPVMREVVAEAGFVAPDARVDDYGNALAEALQAPDGLRTTAANRIRARYPLEARLRALQDTLRPELESPPHRRG